MKGLDRAVELLRPFVGSKNWDYCVVWKLGDDPSRFIEWLGCCCGGGKVKRKREEEINQSVPLCRDLHFKHRISSKACEALACFPSAMPLYSGIHGEVVTSTQAKWINASAPDSNSSSEPFGTRVLIPVLGGLVELFAAKDIAKDQKIIDFITAQFNVLKQEGMFAHGHSSLSECCLDPFPEQNLHTASHLLSLLPAAQILYTLNQSNAHSSFDGSSTVSSLTYDHPSFDSCSGYLLQDGILKQSVEKPSGTRKFKYDENLSKHQAGLFPDCGKEVAKVSQKSECRSKNLVTERNRRNRINDGLFTLRALVPKISKMNKAAILEDAVDYIAELEMKIKELQDELKEIEKEECRKNGTELLISESEASIMKRNHLPPNEINQDANSFDEKEKIEVQVEVNQIGKREFLIKLFREKSRGGFGRLMDAIHSQGLQVVDANMTTFDGLVLTILKVEAILKDVQPRRLRESLLKLRG